MRLDIRTLSLAGLVLLLLASVGFAQEMTEEETLKTALVERLQTIRADSGVGAVSLEERLTTAAAAHAAEMASEGYFNHVSPHKDHAYPEDRAEKKGYKWAVVRENLYHSPNTDIEGFLDEAFTQWMASKFHKENLVHAEVVDIGVGLSTSKSGERVVVLMFGKEM